jgi:hypothetical protein
MKKLLLVLVVVLFMGCGYNIQSINSNDNSYTLVKLITPVGTDGIQDKAMIKGMYPTAIAIFQKDLSEYYILLKKE